MKPGPGKPRAAARAPSPPPAKGRRLLPRISLAAATYLVFGALVVWLAIYDQRLQNANPAALLSPDAAGSRGEYLVNTAERPLEALPYLRRSLEGIEGVRWQGHLRLASLLSTLSVRLVPRAGIVQPLARSSIERVALARECEREYGRAWDLAPPGEARARVASLYAEHLFMWGRVWEAFVMMRAAQDEVPGDKKRSERADLFQLMLEHPERFKTTQELMLAAPDTGAGAGAR